MKHLLWFFLVLLTVVSASAQQVTGDTQFATILPDFQGQILQYAFPISPFGGWVENQHLPKYEFTELPNVVQVQTVKGQTQIYLKDVHDICGPKAGSFGACIFTGILTGDLVVANEVLLDSAYQHVSGTFVGTFTDAQGDVYQNIPALLSFDTFPTIDTVYWPSYGGVTIVLQPNH